MKLKLSHDAIPKRTGENKCKGGLQLGIVNRLQGNKCHQPPIIQTPPCNVCPMAVVGADQLIPSVDLE
jgi:hypothetical protein